MAYQVATETDASLPTPACNAVPVGLAEDAVLAKALIARERSAPALAWQRFRPVVHATLKRLLGPGEDIADLTQDVFARFFDKVQQLRSLDALRPFVIGIAFRRAREEIRRRHVRRTLRPMVETHFGDRPVDWDPGNRQAAARLFMVLERMGTDGQIYSLRVLEGRELAEIAALTTLSISTVRRRLARVTKRMERIANSDVDALLPDETGGTLQLALAAG